MGSTHGNLCSLYNRTDFFSVVLTVKLLYNLLCLSVGTFDFLGCFLNIPYHRYVGQARKDKYILICKGFVILNYQSYPSLFSFSSFFMTIKHLLYNSFCSFVNISIIFLWFATFERFFYFIPITFTKLIQFQVKYFDIKSVCPSFLITIRYDLVSVANL